MDELIIRSLQGRASLTEEARLSDWRRASLAHERRYRDLSRLWELTGLAAPEALPVPAWAITSRSAEPGDSGTAGAPSPATPLARVAQRTVATIDMVSEVTRAPRHLVERFQHIPTVLVFEALGRVNAVDGGIRPIRVPVSLVGTAITVRPLHGDALAIHAAINLAGAGDIVVVDAQGQTATAVWGYLATLAAQQRGIAGAVVDGAARERDEIARASFSLFCRGFTADAAPGGSGGVINDPILCGHVLVRPGDIVVGDGDGVVVVGREQAEDVLLRAEARLKREQEWLDRLRSGRMDLPSPGRDRLE